MPSTYETHNKYFSFKEFFKCKGTAGEGYLDRAVIRGSVTS